MGTHRLDVHACAMLCLLTRCAWSERLPAPFTRRAVRQMMETGALEGLVLREVKGVQRASLERAAALLSRVSTVFDCLQKYEEQGYTMLFPDDPSYPQSLGVLGENAPLFLFAKGNMKLLENKKIAVAGSRKILRETRETALDTGAMIALAGYTLVSGGARGTDTAAQMGALGAGGSALIVPALPEAELMQSETLRKGLENGRLLLLSDAPPDEPFSAGKALSRNRVIYALGEAAFVVAAREGIGGSWHGATSCLKGGWRPVFVWDGDNADTAGNRALLNLGARAYSTKTSLLPYFERVRVYNEESERGRSE